MSDGVEMMLGFPDEIWRETARPRVKPTRSPSLYPTEYVIAAQSIAAIDMITMIEMLSATLLLPILEAAYQLPK